MDSGNEADILILTAVFGFASTLFMVLRLAIRKIKKRPLDISDYLTLIAIACVQARTALTTVVVLWGNNNDYLFDEHPDPTEIYHLKAVVLLFYRRIFSVLPAAARIIAIYWIVLCATYLAAQAACVLDCVPLRLYWQVVPNPGSCTRAHIQLSTFISMNIFTDVLLIVFPVPWILSLQHTTLKRRLQVIGLFSIGVFLIAIALARLPVYKDGTSQDRRHIWGSIEQFCSALVANLPVIYSLLRKTSSGQIPPRLTGAASLDRRGPPRSSSLSSWASEVELGSWPSPNTTLDSKGTSTIRIDHLERAVIPRDPP
ncbi:PTH11-type GPCR protein [Metarhizium brunneum]